MPSVGCLTADCTIILHDRCEAVSVNFLQEAPPVCDAYFLVNVLHNWEDDICCQILKNISRSMLADSKLWVVEYVLEPGPGFPWQNCLI